MVVAHGLWSRGTGLLLWFEAGEPGAGAAGMHPCAVADAAALPAPPRAWGARLQDALSPVALRRRPELLVPTAAGIPVPSSGHPPPADGLTGWRVPATALAPPDAADLLHEVAHLHSAHEDEWTLGAELRFLGEVASGVARWVYSGRVVPAVCTIDDEHWVRWTLVDDGPVRTWRTQLAAALPPVLRAEVVEGHTPSGAEVIDDLVDELTDAVVRATLRLSEPAVTALHPLVFALETGEPLETFGSGHRRLRVALREWATSSTLDTPEVVFRLVEPTEFDPVAAQQHDGPREPTWILETCLRSADTAPVPVRSLPRSPEHTGLALTALGRAMTAWPRLRRITPDVREHVVALSTADAVELVSRGAQQLRAAGITVLLPRAWTRLDPSMSLHVSTPPATAAVTTGAVGMDQLVTYSWRLALGEVELTAAELAELARNKAELVRLRGDWVRVDGTVLARAARYVAAHSSGVHGASLGQVLGELTGADTPPAPVTEVVATGWLGDLLDAHPDERLTSVGAPHGLQTTLRPYQQRGLDWLDFVNPGILGSAQGFRARFAVPIERDREASALTRLRTVTRPFVLRRCKTDPAVITDLPAKNELTVLANLTAEQAALYQAVVDDMLAKITESEGMQRKALVLSTLTRLKQVCNHPAQFLADGSAVLRRGAHRSGKLDLVEDVLTSVLGDGERALLFTQFRQFGDLVGPWFAQRFGVEVPFLHGGVSRTRREAMVARFQSGVDAPPLMLLSLKTGGTGLNLTAANHVVHLDRWWNPAVENQATDRAFRIGQRKEVAVRKLVCVGTVEERIDTLISGKRDLADLAVGAGEGWITELGTAELRELLTLGADAVGE